MEAGIFTRIAQLCRAREERLGERWRALVSASLGGRVPETQVDKEQREILDVLLTALAQEAGRDIEAEPYAELRALLMELSRSRARQGFSPRETAISVFALKEAVLEVFDQEADAEAFREFVAFSQLIDELALLTFETYARAREEVISSQAEQLLELATPVVKVWDGVLALPLVGTLGSARAQVVMEKLLQTLVDTGSEYAIIDITGVPAVDTQVAQHLLKTVMAARLMGAECIISGIRPQIAQTIVALGIEFGDIATKATLADALVLAISRTGASVGGELTKRGR
ncbi:STAS domain-containing protein [Planotetraspora sp. GP83]|uniref:STAS domain-containing protein n=1 Tax=Planotetraspora sp. GP83 TaxID=3156264 RepID=UPI003513D468